MAETLTKWCTFHVTTL